MSGLTFGDATLSLAGDPLATVTVKTCKAGKHHYIGGSRCTLCKRERERRNRRVAKLAPLMADVLTRALNQYHYPSGRPDIYLLRDMESVLQHFQAASR